MEDRTLKKVFLTPPPPFSKNRKNHCPTLCDGGKKTTDFTSKLAKKKRRSPFIKNNQIDNYQSTLSGVKPEGLSMN
ncbi:hypothetical protein AYI68_g7236 [Smittium mucronatum]|uniref:Uncharacterized protein n=1 Tax=Smittium mucronatum TaxID=133383 RepID=A0A1R0GPB0_9FUNG|nr:hypothetical protein AYI68_g7236 [Smittium mucronatum]